MHVHANGINIHYRIDGNPSGPWLMFSNSLATNVSMWDGQIAELGKTFRILRYDQRGHGQTEAPSGRYTFDVLAQDAIALLDALVIERTHFCGLSMGGVTAIVLAQQYPKRLDRVIVCDSGGAASEASTKQWEDRIAIALAQGMAPLVAGTVERWFPAQIMATNPPYLTNVRDMVATTPVNGYYGCGSALAHQDYSAGLAAIKHRVLFLVGAQDNTVAAMKKMHETVAGSKWCLLDPAGHISNLDQPAAFNRAVSEFLAAG
jgi:3-oxoadipate enol-lactonase